MRIAPASSPPKVTVGFPVYNGERYIREALESLRAQDYPNMAIIISDNASTDATISICREYAARDSRIALCENKSNLGAAVNFIKVLDMADGPYFMWAAHDDRWEPQFISKCVEQLENHPDAVMSFSKVAFIDPAGNKVIDDNYNEVATYGMDIHARVKTMVSRMNWYAIYGVFRREVLKKKIMYTTYGPDVLYLMQCALDGPFIIIPEALFIYRLRAKTYVDDLTTVNNEKKKKPFTLTPCTELARNLLAIIAQSDLDEQLKTTLQSDLLQMFSFHNLTWRNVILSENPFLQTAIDLTGPQIQTVTSLCSLFSALLLTGSNLSENTVSTENVPRDTPAAKNQQENLALRAPQSAKKQAQIRVLFQNRGGLQQQPGGDSVVMDNLKKLLEAKGVFVDVNSDPCCNVSGYDVVHLFNLTLPAITELFARNAFSHGVPFVVTSLQEDFPLYISKSSAYVQMFRLYLQADQNQEVWEKGATVIQSTPPPPAQLITSPFAIQHADRILTCGETEARFIRSHFPDAACEPVFFGSSIKESTADPDLFEKQFDVKDFVLCVGRLEMRKNQLMLMKALEDDDVPVVFVDSGFTYQPVYVDLCKRFRRKGRTIFTGRLSEDLLISAYRAAAVHCLPSWYELPGLVTLEAARYGCVIVASSWGAIKDYMGDTIVYCEPDDPGSIRQAVNKAMALEKSDAVIRRASEFTWERSAASAMKIYQDIGSQIAQSAKKAAPGPQPQSSPPINVFDFVQKVTQLVEANKNTEAIDFYDSYRVLYKEHLYLGKFDSLVEVMKAKRRAQGPASS
jgi:glycosyltransferase involved in cell wall biosynthesis